MNLRLALFFSLFIFPVSLYAQSSIYYESNDKTYRLFIPSDWEKKKKIFGNTVFSYKPPNNKKEGFMPTTMELEIGTLKEGYQNADIKEIAALEAGITKNQLGNGISIFTDTFRTINNKLWWEFAFTTKSPKKTKATFYILKTIHNQVTYALTFNGPDAYFDKYMGKALGSMYSFMFYTKDKTPYKNKISQDQTNFTKSLKAFEGTYKQQVENYSHTILISNAGNDIYLAKELREFLIEGKKVRFDADLIVEAVNDDKITLSTDAVSVCDTSIRWEKAVFNLSKTETGLTGVIASKGKGFEGYELSLVKQKQVPSNNNLANNGKLGLNETDLNNQTSSGYGTPDAESGELNEPLNIKQFGGGKVTRKSKSELIIITSGGKSISLKNKGGDEDEGQIRYKFLGFIQELNSYVIDQVGMEADTYTLVNKISGSIADIPSLEYAMSADKKRIAVYNNDIINSMEQSFIKILSVSNNGLKESFSKITFDAATNKGWGATSLTWLDNNTVEVNKAVADAATEELKPAGKSWLTMQTGKWSLVNTKPPKKADKLEVMPSAEELPIYDGTQTSIGKATVVPSASERIMVGGTTPDELGKILITALKSNDKKVWYGCILNATMSQAQERLETIRKHLVMDGLTNWSLLKFKRVTYSEVSHNGKVKVGEYRFFHVEFSYGTEYLGRIECNLIRLHKGKYIVLNPFYGGGIKRKEEYR